MSASAYITKWYFWCVCVYVDVFVCVCVCMCILFPNKFMYKHILYGTWLVTEKTGKTKKLKRYEDTQSLLILYKTISLHFYSSLFLLCLDAFDNATRFNITILVLLSIHLTNSQNTYNTCILSHIAPYGKQKMCWNEFKKGRKMRHFCQLWCVCVHYIDICVRIKIYSARFPQKKNPYYFGIYSEICMHVIKYYIHIVFVLIGYILVYPNTSQWVSEQTLNGIIFSLSLYMSLILCLFIPVVFLSVLIYFGGDFYESFVALSFLFYVHTQDMKLLYCVYRRRIQLNIINSRLYIRKIILNACTHTHHSKENKKTDELRQTKRCF